MRENDYYTALNHGQAYADRFVGGDTWLPCWAVGDAQRQHAMADPKKGGMENVQDIHDYIVNEMVGAHNLRGSDEEWTHLGAAVHTIQDSYSSAHIWRDFKVYEGDPTAPIVSINVFDPLSVGSGGPIKFITESRSGTHVSLFDSVLTDDKGHVTSGSGKAAIAATLELIRAYEAAAGMPEAQAIREFDGLISRYINPAPNVQVNKAVDDNWKQERDKRLNAEKNSSAGPGKAIAIAAAAAIALALGVAVAHSQSQPPPVVHGSATHHYKVLSAAGTVVAKFSDQSGSGLSTKGSGTSTTRYMCCAGSSVKADGVLSGANGPNGFIAPSMGELTMSGSAINTDLQCTVTYPGSTPSLSHDPAISTAVHGRTVHAVWSVLPISVGGVRAGGAGGAGGCPFLANLDLAYDQENRLLGKDYSLSTFEQATPFTISITAHYADKAWDVTWDLKMTLKRVD